MLHPSFVLMGIVYFALLCACVCATYDMMRMEGFPASCGTRMSTILFRATMALCAGLLWPITMLGALLCGLMEWIEARG